MVSTPDTVLCSINEAINQVLSATRWWTKFTDTPPGAFPRTTPVSRLFAVNSRLFTNLTPNSKIDYVYRLTTKKFLSIPDVPDTHSILSDT